MFFDKLTNLQSSRSNEDGLHLRVGDFKAAGVSIVHQPLYGVAIETSIQLV